METTQHFYAAYQEARTRLQLVLNALTSEDLAKKLQTCPNSCGFLLRHIGDVELLFSKNVFKLEDVQVKAKTVMDQKDTGETFENGFILLNSSKTELKIIHFWGE
jgi:hypothetical protein